MDSDAESAKLDDWDQQDRMLLRGVGARIRRRRRALDITQAELAERARTTRPRIVEIERQNNGDKNLTITALRHIAHGLGCHIADLLDDRD